MFLGNFYDNGYLYWFALHNLSTKISGKLLLYLHFIISYIQMFYINRIGRRERGAYKLSSSEKGGFLEMGAYLGGGWANRGFMVVLPTCENQLSSCCKC